MTLENATKELEKLGLKIKVLETVESDEEEIHDMDREELGFPQLRNYGEYLENDLLDSSCSKEIITKFKEVNNLYYKYDECHISFESLLAELNTAKPNGLIKLIYESLSEISDIPHIVDVESITDSEIKDIRAWVHTQNKRASEIERMDPLPDEIVFGKAITIRGIDGSKVYFYIGNNQISPDEGSEEIIPIVLSNEEETIASGYIKLIVGYLKFDEDGGVVDGMEDDVNYEYQSILNKLDEFIQMKNYIAVYSKQFPELNNFFKEHPNFSKTNEFKNNVIVNIAFPLSTYNDNAENMVQLNEQGYRGNVNLTEASGNRVLTADPGFADYSGGNFELSFKLTDNFPNMKMSSFGIIK